MKKLMPILIIVLSSLLMTKEVWSLPNCSGNYWNNCIGEWTYPNGSVYVGEYKNDLRDGQGTLTGSDGSVFKGEFFYDGPRKGIITQPNGTNLFLECNNSICSGKGTVVIDGVGKYVGEIRNNLFHGQGKFTHPDGTTEEGIWENNVLVKSTPTSTSSANNTTYTATSTSSANKTTSSNTNDEKQLICENYRKAANDCPSSHQERWAIQKNYILNTSKLQGDTGTLYTKMCGKKTSDVKNVYITSTANHLLIQDDWDIFNIDRKTLMGAYQTMIDYKGESARVYLCKVLEIDTSSNKI